MLHLTTTCPDLDTARHIARAALTNRLVACANIQPGLVSLFHWDNAVQDEAEVTLTFKTREDHLDALIHLIELHHPYDLPVITWEFVQTTPDARAWLMRETRAGADRP